MVNQAPHYAEAFYVAPGQCFRFVHSGVGHAAHCPDPVVRRGRFVDLKGKRWEVDACAQHAEELASEIRGHPSDGSGRVGRKHPS